MDRRLKDKYLTIVVQVLAFIVAIVGMMAMLYAYQHIPEKDQDFIRMIMLQPQD